MRYPNMKKNLFLPVQAFFYFENFQSTRTSTLFHLADIPEGKKANALSFGTGGGELVWGNLLLRMK